MQKIVIALLSLTALSGCAAPDSDIAAQGEDGCVVTGPDDFSCIQADLDQGTQTEHLHDYWNGADRSTVMDRPHEDLGPGFSGEEQTVAHEYRGDTGELILQGTQFVEVTITWTDDSLDRYSDPQLWVQTAAESNTSMISTIESGVPVQWEITADDWDLPHQRLSAWIFELRLSQPPDNSGIRFKAETNILVEIERGLEIPLFPAHPDFWDGGNITEIHLLTDTHTVQYAHDPGDGGCDGFSCQKPHSPLDGIIVPPGTQRVEVTLTLENSADSLQLQYHGADTRQYTRLTPDSQEGMTQHYVINADGSNDGPYSLQSLWEFMVYIKGPVEDGFVSETYDIDATAYND